jgi:hypothetical protein
MSDSTERAGFATAELHNKEAWQSDPGYGSVHRSGDQTLRFLCGRRQDLRHSSGIPARLAHKFQSAKLTII